MALTDAGRKEFVRCVKEMRRGRVSSNAMADDLLSRLTGAGLVLSGPEPDLDAMAQALEEAGYAVTPPEAP
ncbi:MAG: hypothetical protein K0R61_69 [Microvirga sp.]|jgi:hypothetical protein|nr:hypothetical protein [Microvirga sp.]MDF2969619.1 hypothetical protein [Microvirga sp.]